MATKKKAKGVLGQIGDAVAAGAGAVADAGSKAIHAVGDLLPAGDAAPKKKAGAARKVAPKAAAEKAVAAKPKEAKVKPAPAAARSKASKAKAAGSPEPKGKAAKPRRAAGKKG